jgi:hypothetical protein
VRERGVAASFFKDVCWEYTITLDCQYCSEFCYCCQGGWEMQSHSGIPFLTLQLTTEISIWSTRIYSYSSLIVSASLHVLLLLGVMQWNLNVLRSDSFQEKLSQCNIFRWVWRNLSSKLVFTFFLLLLSFLNVPLISVQNLFSGYLGIYKTWHNVF